MASSIVFLGTGGDSIVVGKQILRSGGFLLISDESQFHIDPGPGALGCLKENGFHPREHTAVFVTHPHVNHASDVNALLSAMTLNGLDKRGVLISSKSVYFGNQDVDPAVSRFHKELVERCIALDEGGKIGINDVDIRFTYAKHYNSGAVGYKFFTQDATISYTGDTDFNDNLVAAHQGADVLIVNVKHPFGMKQKYHLDTESAAKLIEKVKPQLAIITHYGVKMLEADPIDQARMIQRHSGVQTIAAKDGSVIIPRTYIGQKRQKTLQNY